MKEIDGSGIHAIANTRAVDIPSDQSGTLELLKMLRHRRLGKGQLIDDVSTDTAVAAHKDAKDRDTRRMSKGLGHLRKKLVGLRFACGERLGIGDGGTTF